MNTNLRFSALGLLLLCISTASCQSRRAAIDVLVTNGRIESGFPYVVEIRMDEKGWCSGTFVSDSLLLTAAHCVHRAKKVAYGEAIATREHFFIHPQWPSGGDACKKSRPARYDLALVRFPANTFTSKEVATLRDNASKADEEFIIVGFGNSVIEPFNKFCRLPEERQESGKCEVELGERNDESKLKYSTLFTFDGPENPEDSSVGCPVECPTAALKSSLSEAGTSYDDFINEKCDGNFRDRGYRETGRGTKRSGINRISTVEEGVIKFSGVINGIGDGMDSASGAGDSGGPLFVKEDGKIAQIGLTHGGSVLFKEGSFRKYSTYADLFDETNRNWLKEVTSAKDLNFPQFKPSK